MIIEEDMGTPIWMAASKTVYPDLSCIDMAYIFHVFFREYLGLVWGGEAVALSHL